MTESETPCENTRETSDKKMTKKRKKGGDYDMKKEDWNIKLRKGKLPRNLLCGRRLRKKDETQH